MIFDRERTELAVLAATFEPLRQAVITKKKQLTSEIADHYKTLNQRLTDSVTMCKTQYKLMEKVTLGTTSQLWVIMVFVFMVFGIGVYVWIHEHQISF